MRHRWFTFVRLSDSYLTVLIPPFNHIVHDLAVASSAACGSLKSTPVGRLRWTYHHLRYSIALTHIPGTLQVAHFFQKYFAKIVTRRKRTLEISGNSILSCPFTICPILNRSEH